MGVTLLGNISGKASVPDSESSGSVQTTLSLDPRDPGEYRRPSLALVNRCRRTDA